jgi:Cu+-exporting ATPase
MKKLKLTIEGMHCASCGVNIERSLRKIHGVKNVGISMMLKKGNIEVEDFVSNEEIVNAVKKAGYKVSKVE